MNWNIAGRKRMQTVLLLSWHLLQVTEKIHKQFHSVQSSLAGIKADSSWTQNYRSYGLSRLNQFGCFNHLTFLMSALCCLCMLLHLAEEQASIDEEHYNKFTFSPLPYQNLSALLATFSRSCQSTATEFCLAEMIGGLWNFITLFSRFI